MLDGIVIIIIIIIIIIVTGIISAGQADTHSQWANIIFHTCVWQGMKIAYKRRILAGLHVLLQYLLIALYQRTKFHNPNFKSL